jgi:hypothetical protein
MSAGSTGDRSYPLHRLAERRLDIEVTHGHLNMIGEARHLCGITHEHAHSLPCIEQLRHQVRANIACRSGDQDHGTTFRLNLTVCLKDVGRLPSPQLMIYDIITHRW